MSSIRFTVSRVSEFKTGADSRAKEVTLTEDPAPAADAGRGSIAISFTLHDPKQAADYVLDAPFVLAPEATIKSK